jgi:hypothetical protein
MQQLRFGLPDCVNAILVDTLAIDALLARLARGYNPRDAYDLYDLLTQIALRDRVWLLPAGTDLYSIGLMQPWLSNGAALWLPKRRRAVMDVENLHRTNPRPVFVAAEHRRMSKFVQTANFYQLPCYVTSDQSSTFEVIGAPHFENALCDLIGQYSSVEHRIRIGMLRRGVSHPHFVNLRIPPLPFEIIRRSSSLEDVIWRTLDVRHEYSKIRREFGEVSAQLADITVSPAKKLREISSLERSWKAVHKLADGAIDVPYGKAGGYLEQFLVSGVQLGFGLGTLEPGSILGGTIGIGHSAARLLTPVAQFKRAAWRLQPLSHTVRECWTTSDREMLSHLNRVFGAPR